MRFIPRINVSRRTKDKRDIPFESFGEVWSEEDVQRHLHAVSAAAPPNTFVEYLSCPDGDASKASPGKLFLDRDEYVGESEPTPEEYDAHMKCVVDHVQSLIDGLSTDHNDLTFVIATRHGYCLKHKQFKLSFRPFVQGMTIRYTDIPHVIRLMGQQGFWDMTVYKTSEQLLAAINCCKGLIGNIADTRVLQPQPGFTDPLLYIVQHVSDGWMLLDLPPDFVSEPMVADSQSQGTGIQPGLLPPADPIYVCDLIRCLNATTSNDRKQWLQVAIISKLLGGGGGEEDAFLEDWLKFSEKGDKFTGRVDCIRTWQSLHLNRATCGLGTLCYFARNDDPLGYRTACLAHKSRSKVVTRDMCSLSDNENEPQLELIGAEHAPQATTLSIEKVRKAVDAVIARLGMTDVDVDSFVLSKAGTMLCVTLTASLDGPPPRSIMVELDTTTLKLTVDGVDAGYYHNDPGTGIPVAYSLSKLHNTFSDDMSWTASRPSDGSVRFLADKGGAVIDASNFDRTLKERSAKISVTGAPPKTKHSMKDMQWLQTAHDGAIQDAVQSRLGLGNIFAIFQNGNNNQVTINNHVDSAATDFALIRDKLLDHASSRGMRKRGGFIYEPVEGCPCAYVERYTYEKYINEALKDNEIYTNNPRRFDEALKFLQNYEVSKLPQLEADLDILSFANGVLQLATCVFTPYPVIDSQLANQVARHHIPYEYSGSTDTPFLDTILNAQFDPDVADMLCALVGRLFFEVNKMDGWQIMPYLVGIGGTGKSLILNVVQHLFAPGAVGNLAAKREDVFGMANLVGKEVVMGRDMPAKLSGSLPQEIMQTMTAGEGMEIPRKGLTALNVTWKAACIMASNHMPDYANTGNNVGRRIVTFRFEKTVSSPQEDLLQRLLDTELPNIVKRCLVAYASLRERVKVVKGFWKAVPPIMLEWQDKLAASTNKLHEFLLMEDHERECSIKLVPGFVTWLLDLKVFFEKKMGSTLKLGTAANSAWTPDPAVFSAFGFSLSTQRVSVCMECKQRAPERGGDKCCESYKTLNRRLKDVVFDMQLEPIDG